MSIVVAISSYAGVRGALRDSERFSSRGAAEEDALPAELQSQIHPLVVGTGFLLLPLCGNTQVGRAFLHRPGGNDRGAKEARNENVSDPRRHRMPP